MANKEIKNLLRDKISESIREAVKSVNPEAAEKLKKTVLHSAKDLSVKFSKKIKELVKEEKRKLKKRTKKEKKTTKAKLKAEKRAEMPKLNNIEKPDPATGLNTNPSAKTTLASKKKQTSKAAKNFRSVSSSQNQNPSSA